MSSASVSAGPAARPEPRVGWQLITWLGVVFTVLGLLTQAVVWYPLSIGVPEWEFGTVSESLDSIPLFGLGLGFLLAGALARGSRWQARLLALMFTLLALVIVAAAALYATVIPQTLKAVPGPQVLTAIKKGITKTSIQAVLYPIGFIWIAIWALRQSNRRRSG